jgi:hypothetical protein
VVRVSVCGLKEGQGWLHRDGTLYRRRIDPDGARRPLRATALGCCLEAGQATGSERIIVASAAHDNGRLVLSSMASSLRELTSLPLIARADAVGAGCL